MVKKGLTSKPQVSSSAAQKDLDRAEKQFEQFDREIKDLTLDRMNSAPKEESVQSTELSQAQIQKSNDVYLKAKRSISSKEKFNEAFRSDYNFAQEYVNFIAENKEIIGESIDLWTKPFPGMPAEEWSVPTNKPVWGPRHLAEQIKRCTFHRLIMQDRAVSVDYAGSYTGVMVADTTVQRLDAHPVSQKKSIFMGGSGF